MFQFRRRLLLKLLKLSDIFILIFALFLAFRLTTDPPYHFTLGNFLSFRMKVGHFIGILCMIISWHLIFSGFKLYRSRRLDAGYKEWFDINKATITGTGVFIIMCFIFDADGVTPGLVAVFWLSSMLLTVAFRSLLRFVLRWLRTRGRNLRLVLIAGTNQRAYDFAHTITTRKDLGYRLVGYIDNNIFQQNPDIELLGSIDDISRILEEKIIDEVFIALPVKSCYDDIQKIVKKAEEQGITVNHLSQLFNTRTVNSTVDDFEEFAVMKIASNANYGWQYILKRVIDIIVASSTIILTFPIMVVAAFIIILDSPGPILFIQKRVGYNKRIFRLYKFRTMVKGADDMQKELSIFNEMDGPVFKMQNDPRVTKVGRILRKLSIDELPQLFNILKSDMSLVGPRPLPVRDYSGFDQDWQRRRFSVLPGITCTWQINGRNNISFEEWMKMDIRYIDNWKLSDDLKILFKTIPAVLKGSGAS